MKILKIGLLLLGFYNWHSSRKQLAADFDDFADLHLHCERAGELLERVFAASHRAIANVLAAQPWAALAVETSGCIVLANAAAQLLPELRDLPNVLALRFDRRAEAALATFLKDCRKAAEPARPLVVNGWSKDTDAAVILVFERLPAAFSDFADAEGATGPVIVAKTTITAFDKAIWNTISAAYDLADAESAVMRLLVEGCSLEEAARRRARSPNTLKSQAKSVLAKTGKGKQAELVRLVTTLAHLVGKGGPRAADAAADEAGDHSQLQLADGRSQKYVEVGLRDGRPVLFLQPTARPDFTAELRRDFAAAALRVITPVRPGSWGMLRATAGWGPEDAARDYRALTYEFGLTQSALVGYRAGAPQALHLAALCPGYFRCVPRVDTGAPLDRMAKIEKMPPWPRLLFSGVRFAPQFARLMRFGGVNMRRRRNDDENWARFCFRGNSVDDRLIEDPPGIAGSGRASSGIRWRIPTNSFAICRRGHRTGRRSPTGFSQPPRSASSMAPGRGGFLQLTSRISALPAKVSPAGSFPVPAIFCCTLTER